MFKSVFCSIILFIAVSVFSCADKNDGDKSNDKTFKTCKMVVISPYGCYQEIEFTGQGEGLLKSGLRDGDIIDEDVRFDTLFSIDSFYIKNEQDLKGVHRIIKSILDNTDMKKGHKDDAYRCKLFIDGVNKIDIYSLSKDLHELLRYLINYLPLSNDKCEFFELFKKSLQSSQ
ncbi:MAG TPA: hypothetical protein PKY82_27875 [Pyrinomonadaceae bacterium]|nr:hypothetical protein [Pyrinomonadaceae bacterium]